LHAVYSTDHFTSRLSHTHKVLMYDSRRFVPDVSVFPPGHEAVEKYLNRADVRAALHATSTPQAYVECSDPPMQALGHQVKASRPLFSPTPLPRPP